VRKLLDILVAPFRFVGSAIAMVIVALGWSKAEKEEGEG
jgi:hypothetical protein